MSNIKEKKFDYSLVDTDTAKRWRELKEYDVNSRIDFIKNRGWVLHEAKRTAKENNNYTQKTFMEWAEKEIGCKKDRVYKYINAYKTIKNNKNLPEKTDLSIDILAALEKNTTPNEVKEKIKSGEIKTQREMQELRKKLNAERKEKERMEKQLKQQIEQLKNADPEKEYVEVTKEVIPDDYEEMKKTLETIERKKNELEERKEELEERVGNIDTAKSEVREALKRKNAIDEEINDLIEYQQTLEDQNNVMKHRAEIVQGVKRAVKKSMQTKPDVEMLLDREVEMAESDLEEIEYEAEQLAKYAKELFRYVAKKRNNDTFKEGDVIDVN